jgi:hypothetical protein
MTRVATLQQLPNRCCPKASLANGGRKHDVQYEWVILVLAWVLIEESSMCELSLRSCCGQDDSDAFTPERFAREVRRLAIDAYKGLTYPHVPQAELDGLKRRASELFGQTEVPRSAEMTRWLRNIGRAIDVRLKYDTKVSPSPRRKGVADGRIGRSPAPRLFARERPAHVLTGRE